MIPLSDAPVKYPEAAGIHSHQLIENTLQGGFFFFFFRNPELLPGDIL